MLKISLKARKEIIEPDRTFKKVNKDPAYIALVPFIENPAKELPKIIRINRPAATITSGV